MCLNWNVKDQWKWDLYGWFCWYFCCLWFCWYLCRLQLGLNTQCWDRIFTKFSDISNNWKMQLPDFAREKSQPAATASGVKHSVICPFMDAQIDRCVFRFSDTRTSFQLKFQIFSRSQISCFCFIDRNHITTQVEQDHHEIASYFFFLKMHDFN